MGGEIDKLFVSLGADTSGLKAGFTSVSGMLANCTNQIRAAAPGWSLALAGIGIGVAVAAIDARKEIKAGINEITNLTGKTGPELDKLADNMRNVSKGVPQSFKEIGDAVGMLAQRTSLTDKPLEALATQELNLARIQKTDLSDGIRLTTRLFGDWNVAAEKQSDSMDFLFRVSTNTGISVAALAEKITYAGVPLRQLGFDFESSAAMVGKWEKEGVNVDMLMRSLNLSSVRLAKQGVPDMSAAWAEMTERIKGAKTNTEAITIATEYFGARAASNMAGAIREGRFELDELKKALGATGVTINDTAEQTLGLGGRFAELGHSAMIVLEPLGEKLLGALTKAVDKIREWINQGKLDEWARTAKAALSDFWAVVQAGWSIIDGVAHALGGWKDALIILGVTWAGLKVVGWTAAITDFGAALVGVSGIAVGGGLTGFAVTIGGILGTVGSLTAGLPLLGVALINSAQTGQSIIPTWTELKNSFKEMIKNWGELLGIIEKPQAEKALESLTNAWDKMCDSIDAGTKQTFPALTDFRNHWSDFEKYFRSMSSGMRSEFIKMLAQLAETAGDQGKAIPEELLAALANTEPEISAAAGRLVGAWAWSLMTNGNTMGPGAGRSLADAVFQGLRTGTADLENMGVEAIGSWISGLDLGFTPEEVQANAQKIYNILQGGVPAPTEGQGQGADYTQGVADGVNAGQPQVQDAVDSVNETLDGIEKNPVVTVNAIDNASGVIRGITSSLVDLQNQAGGKQTIGINVGGFGGYPQGGGGSGGGAPGSRIGGFGALAAGNLEAQGSIEALLPSLVDMMSDLRGVSEEEEKANRNIQQNDRVIQDVVRSWDGYSKTQKQAIITALEQHRAFLEQNATIPGATRMVDNLAVAIANLNDCMDTSIDVLEKQATLLEQFGGTAEDLTKITATQFDLMIDKVRSLGEELIKTTGTIPQQILGEWAKSTGRMREVLTTEIWSAIEAMMAIWRERGVPYTQDILNILADVINRTEEFKSIPNPAEYFAGWFAQLGLAPERINELVSIVMGLLNLSAPAAAVSGPVTPGWVSTIVEQMGLPSYASGGTAWTPQLAWIAEREPEVITPLSRMSGSGGFLKGALGAAITIENVNLPGVRHGDQFIDELSREIGRRVKLAQLTGGG